MVYFGRMVFHIRVHEKCGKLYKNVEMCRRWGFVQKCEEIEWETHSFTFLHLIIMLLSNFSQLHYSILSFTFLHFFFSSWALFPTFLHFSTLSHIVLHFSTLFCIFPHISIFYLYAILIRIIQAWSPIV